MSDMNETVTRTLAIPGPEGSGEVVSLTIEVYADYSVIDIADSIVDQINGDPDRGDLSARYLTNGLFHLWSKSRDLNETYCVTIGQDRALSVEWFQGFAAC